ncbi:hypothetical protein JCM9279_000258 [Rhodotorula babjevae]
MDLISHKLDAAKDKLERAAMAGSSAGCSTLAGILARESRLASPSSHGGPGSPSVLPTSLSPPSGPTPVRRPSIPTRQSSSSVASTAPHRSRDALRAVELSLTGLQLLLLKPVRPSSDSGYGASDDDEDSAEGLYFDLERALDLIARVTDAHRFGVLHAPLSDPQHDSSSSVDGSGANDDLWRRSAVAAVKLLDHESITVLFSHPVQPPSSHPPFLSRSSSRRSSSVSRSFAHPSSTLPLDTDVKGTAASLLSPQRKLKVTVAIHALYVLALQAWAVQHGPSSPPSASAGASGSSAPIEDPKLLAERYWSTIDRLAAPYAPFGGIGIKEGDEIVQSTQRRLGSIRHQDLGPDEPWRLAKKRGRQAQAQVQAAPTAPSGSSPSAPPPDEGSSAVTIRPALVPQLSTSSGSYGGRTPRGASFHLGADVEEADGEEEAARAAAAPASLDLAPRAAAPNDSMARSPPFALSPPHDLLLSSSSSSKGPASSRRGTGSVQPYPSPPETPPIASDEHAFYPDFQARAPSTLSPPMSSASRLQPLVSPAAGTSSGLPRVTSVRSIASNRSTTSVLSTFKHDPLARYLSGRLRRVGSSASICTAPPDLSGRTRVCRGKGKGKMVEPEPSELFELRGAGAGGVALARAKSRPNALATVEEAEPKTWLSRFWRSSRSVLDEGGRGAPVGLAAAAEEGALDRTRRSSAVHALKIALDRHDEASSTMVMYWGEGESALDEEAEVDEPLSPATDKVASPPASSLRFDEAQLSQADKLRSSLDAKAQQPSTRQAARQRSFLLTDPTSSSASASANTSLSRDRTRTSRRARSRDTSIHSSASSTHSTTADGHLAPPSPSKSGRRRRRRSSAGARSTATGDGAEHAPVPVAMDPLLLELERRSHIGLKTACAACGRRGLNFPACRKCKGTYCSRDCRVGPQHVCRRPGVVAAAAAAEA